jgi:4-amino-4-deoxy-L-arabinose transferase-like glycosyltransferase
MESAPPGIARLRLPAEWRYPAISAALLLAAVLAIHLIVEMGMNDDWSYIYVARGLALRGRLVYHGWADTTMIPQAFWGALFFKALGFSFTAARISTLALALLLVPVLYLLGREAGLKPAFANFATLLVVLCPVFLPEAVSFMTDAPSFFFTAVCLYAALRSAKAEGDRACRRWGLCAGAFGILAGMTRQLCWAAPLWMLAAAAWRQRRRRAALALAAAWIATAAACAATLIWYYRQDYVPRLDLPWPSGPVLSTTSGLIFLLETLAILTIPAAVMLVATSWRLFPRKGWTAAAIPTIAFAAYYESKPLHWPPRLFDTINEFGLLFFGVSPVALRPVALAPAARIAMGVMAIAGSVASLAVLARAAIGFPRPWRDRDLGPFLSIGAPYAATVVLASVIRSQVFDRYLIPVLPVAVILMLWVCQKEMGQRVPLTAWAVVALYAAFGIAITHDAFASARARLQAAESLFAAGIPRSEIMVGLEYDAWTQLEVNGHVNDKRVASPSFAYRPITRCTGPSELRIWYRPWLPDLQPRYFVAEDRLRALSPTSFSQVTYRQWLPLVDRHVAIYTLPDQSALECY